LARSAAESQLSAVASEGILEVGRIITPCLKLGGGDRSRSSLPAPTPLAECRGPDIVRYRTIHITRKLPARAATTLPFGEQLTHVVIDARSFVCIPLPVLRIARPPPGFTASCSLAPLPPFTHTHTHTVAFRPRGTHQRSYFCVELGWMTYSTISSLDI